MKKMILLLSINLLLSCSKDKELNDLKPDDKTNMTTDVVVSVDPTEEELMKYFDIESTQDIDKAANNITTIRESKKIEAKELSVKEAIIEKKDVEQGIITVKVSGKFATKVFSKAYTFSNFVQKPHDSYMLSRANVSWKPEFEKNPEELTGIDFDAFYRLNKKDLITMEYLSKWININAVNRDQKNYKFTPEDLKETEIVEMKYTDRGLNFKLKYKNKEGKEINLHFDKNQYYKTKVILNKEEIKKRYVQGTFQHLDVIFEDLVHVPNEFNLQLIHDGKRLENGNKISCRLSLLTRGDVELANFEYYFEGFKPLSDLSKELVVQTTSELNQYMIRYLINTPDGNVLEKVKKRLHSWVKKVEFGVMIKDYNAQIVDEGSIIHLPNNQLALKLYEEKVNLYGNSVYVLAPRRNRSAFRQDVLLINPYFQINSAVKKQGKLIVELELYNVNEQSLKNLKREIEIEL
ncbi:hypothetical protein C3B47_13490 [Flavobacterium columnare]|uniref:hypothetical protein n=1 Tax=Flavobacterium columnare TaxID=996 RepID=UPI0018969BD2|nr:hypothetical protein [Flavobacterium columnare]MBF6653876.1 hypothetical protein [Flavobacterium columnare]